MLSMAQRIPSRPRPLSFVPPYGMWSTRNEGISFLPRMCVEEEIAQGTLKEIQVTGIQAERKVRLVYPAERTLSHAAQAFLALL